jgi:Ca-activated chloride channel family protein
MAQSLKTNGVVAFTVGVGSPAGTEIQVVNQTGQLELLRDAKGEVVRSRLDEERSGHRAGNEVEVTTRWDNAGRVESVRSAFAALDDPLAGNRARRRGVERFHVPLAFALLLLTVERLIGTRRREKHLRAATPVVGAAQTVLLIGLWLLEFLFISSHE